MIFLTAIVDELGKVMLWCNEAKDNDKIESVLHDHPEWSKKCIELHSI